MEQNKDENRRVCVEVYMSAYSRDRLKAAAAKMNVSLSSLVKIAINEYRDTHKARFEITPALKTNVIKIEDPGLHVDIDKLIKEVDDLYHEP